MLTSWKQNHDDIISFFRKFEINITHMILLPLRSLRVGKKPGPNRVKEFGGKSLPYLYFFLIEVIASYYIYSERFSDKAPLSNQIMQKPTVLN